MKFTPLQGSQLGEIAGQAIKALMAIPVVLGNIAAEISSCDDRLQAIHKDLQAIEGTINQRLENIDQELANIRQQLENNN